MRAWRSFLALTLAIAACDQLIKRLVDHVLREHESRALLTGLLSLTYVRNRGAAFGFLSTANLPHQAWLFTLLGLAALMAIGYYAYRLPPDRRLPHAALALIMGGAIGNLIDRGLRGYVIDFIEVYYGSFHWPAFNIADSAITIGIGLMLLDVVMNPYDSEQPAQAALAADERSVAER
ncbi:MAG: signal peptidase II [Vicinamibacteria bacterium]|jgi:signal peptidase II|nr:signal peptidase II [Vicinamibacteria bacterium]